ncbi:MAG: GTPase ObgE, partial [Paracoccaceae bacterium]
MLEEASGGPVLEMSGAAKLGTTEVLRALRTQIDDDRLRAHVGEAEDTPWQP